MENPMSWDDTTELINDALYVENKQDTADRVLCALEKAGLLKKERNEELREAVDDEINRRNKMLAEGFCGQSLASGIKGFLVKLGAL